MKKFDNAEVAAVFRAYPRKIAAKLLSVRELIFETGAKNAAVGELEETLKWGQPSYLTAKSRSGSTIRIDRVKSGKGQYGIYFHCQTSLVATFRELYGKRFRYEGNRGILFNEDDTLPLEDLGHCILLALTYHLKQPRKLRNLR